jgi:hypothetical protein
MALGSNLTSGHAEGNFINTATFSQSSNVMAFNFSKLLTTTTKSDLLSIFNTGNATLIGVLTANDINTNGNNPITSLNNTIANLTQTDNQMMLQIANNINSINALITSVNNVNNALNFKADIYGYVGCYLLDGVVSSKSFNKYPVFSSEGNLGPSINNQADAVILMPSHSVLLYTGVSYTGTVSTATNPPTATAPIFVNLTTLSVGVNNVESIRLLRWNVSQMNYVEISMSGIS